MPTIRECHRCGGSGKYDGMEPRGCSACGGEGYIEEATDPCIDCGLPDCECFDEELAEFT